MFRTFLVAVIIGLVSCMPTRFILRNPSIYSDRDFYYDDVIIEEIIDDPFISDREYVLIRRPAVEIVYEDYEPTLIDRLANAWDALMN